LEPEGKGGRRVEKKKERLLMGDSLRLGGRTLPKRTHRKTPELQGKKYPVLERVREWRSLDFARKGRFGIEAREDR